MSRRGLFAISGLRRIHVSTLKCRGLDLAIPGWLTWEGLLTSCPTTRRTIHMPDQQAHSRPTRSVKDQCGTSSTQPLESQHQPHSPTTSFSGNICASHAARASNSDSDHSSSHAQSERLSRTTRRQSGTLCSVLRCRANDTRPPSAAGSEMVLSSSSLPWLTLRDMLVYGRR